MKATQASGATPNWFALAGNGNRSLWSGKGRAAAKAVSALRGSSVDDVEHMTFDCSSLHAELQKHKSLYARGGVDSAACFKMDPIELAAFIHRYFKACNEEQEV